MEVFLETQRLLLRRFSLADADNLVRLDADPDVMRFVNGGVATSRDEIEHEVLPAFLDYYQRYEGYGFWAVIEKATGEFAGWFHFRPGQAAAPGEVELGYRLRKPTWGLHRVRSAARHRRGNGRQHGLTAGDGEGRPEAGADLPPALARLGPRRSDRRRGVCAGQGPLAAGPAPRWPRQLTIAGHFTWSPPGLLLLLGVLVGDDGGGEKDQGGGDTGRGSRHLLDHPSILVGQV
jgi:hypothetical protein